METPHTSGSSTEGDSAEAVARRIEAIRLARGGRVDRREADAPRSVPPTAARVVAGRLAQQASRRRGERDASITSLVAETRDRVSRTRRRLGKLIDLWEAEVPPHLCPHTSIVAWRGGVLHVTVDSSATAFALDRLLREGMLDTLRARFEGTLSRVQIRIE